MSSVQAEIAALEEQLRQAELGPNTKFFEEYIADDAVLGFQNGEFVGKAKVVQAHQPGQGPKFTRVEMKDMIIRDHGTTAIVTCTGTYESAKWSGTLHFTRVWLKKNGRWQIIAGAIAN